MELLRITGKRRFNYKGNRYFVQDCPRPSETGKYIATIWTGKGWSILYNWDMSIEKFRTIKDAQRYIRDNWDILETWEA